MTPEEIRTRLDSLAEDLADLALEALREGDAATERRYTRARRAVEKAGHLVSGNPGGDEF